MHKLLHKINSKLSSRKHGEHDSPSDGDPVTDTSAASLSSAQTSTPIIPSASATPQKPSVSEGAGGHQSTVSNRFIIY